MENEDKKFEINRMTHDSWQMFRMLGEVAMGFDRMGKVSTPLVTVYGSARTKIRTKFYGLAESLGRDLVQNGFGVVTGGGPGIMEAANKGAFEAGGVSIGINIALPVEQRPNRYQTLSLEHEYFHTRKMILARYSVGFVVFPGGFGTLDELTEILTFIQTQKLAPFPVYLVSKSYWAGLLEWISNTLIEEKAIAPDDMNLFKVVDAISGIPEEIKAYHAPSADKAGFKIPDDQDRRRAAGQSE